MPFYVRVTAAAHGIHRSAASSSYIRYICVLGVTAFQTGVSQASVPACQEDDVWDYWGYCGEIESLDLMRFPDTGRFKGICFITFKTVSNCTHHSCMLAGAP